MDKDKEISGLNNLEFKIIVQGILVGIIVGIVIMIYKTIIGFGMEGFNKVYSYTRENPKLIIPLFLVLIFLGFIVGIIVKKESYDRWKWYSTGRRGVKWKNKCKLAKSI